MQLGQKILWNRLSSIVVFDKITDSAHVKIIIIFVIHLTNSFFVVQIITISYLVTVMFTFDQ